MKQKHTQKKSARRSFVPSGTGFASELYRKNFNKHYMSPDRTDRRFTKAKPRRTRIVRTEYPKY